MSRTNTFLTIIIFLLISSFYTAQPGAKEKSFYKFRSTLKTQFISEDNLDLGAEDNKQESAFVLDSVSRLNLYPSDDIELYTEIRALNNFGIVTVETDNGEESADDSFIELRRIWTKFSDLMNIKGLSLKIGRQRFKEDRAIWWNRDADALRLGMKGVKTDSFLALSQNLSSYRLGNDDDFGEDEEDRLRIFGALKYQWHDDHKIEGRFLYENDYSGMENDGQLIPSDDRDEEDHKLAWLGLRAQGLFNKPQNPAFKNLTYRADIMGAAGTEDVYDTTSGPSSAWRTVTNIRQRDVLGWAFDGNADFLLNLPAKPTLSLGYAFASGDGDPDGNGTDHAFRQTGLQGNTSYFPERTAVSSSRNYGEVLRPELSNLHILSTGLNFPIFTQSDLNLKYFSYWLDEDARRLRSSGIDAPLNGTGKHIGQALDVTTTYNIGKEHDIENALLRKSAARLRLGAFRSGNAYGDAAREYAYRAFIEFRMRF